jgi:phage terminase large subunit-like protein
MYIVDDYANTSCNSLNAWANANNLNPSTRFSNASIKMSDYGTPGMPKVVVTGNWSHQVYYNSNNTVNATALQTAIAAALEDYSVGITDTDREQVLSFFPNPAVSDVTFRFKADGTNDATLKVYDLTGKLLDIRIYSGLDQGVTTLRYSMEHIPEGVYLLRISDGHSSLSGKVFLQK